jgi:hypothetical protein
VQGPLRYMNFSPDGSQLLVVGPMHGATEVFDGKTLRRLGAYPHSAEQPVVGATFAPDLKSLWLLETGFDESEGDSGRLLRWDPTANRTLEQRALSGAKPIGIGMLGGLPLLFTRDHFTLDPGGSGERTGPALRGGEVTTTFVATADQQLIAHAYGRNVQLYEAETFEAIGPPLKANWRINDEVLRMSFDAPGEHLLARLGSAKQQFAWPVGADRRALPELQRDADLLAPSPRARRVLRLADAAEHAWLRARDPGAWPTQQPPAPRSFIHTGAGGPVSPRSPHATPMQLDLTNFYTVTAFHPHSTRDTVLSTADDLPLGIATLDGVDYDIRGGVELRGDRKQPGSRRSYERQAAGIQVPPVPVAALHVLILATFAVPEANETVYANIRLHYQDGGQAVLPIRTQREVPGMTINDRPTPVGWAVSDMSTVGVLPIHVFSNPRLVNPHPEKIITSLDLQTGQGWSEPVFIAITAEPFDRARDRPVIAAGKSASTQTQAGVK